MNSIEKYFEAEKLQCIIGIFITMVCISLSVYFLYLQKPLGQGLAYVFLPFSVLLLIICLSITIRAPKDIERVTTFFKTEPQKIQTVELPRMEKVMKNFVVIKRVEVLVFMVGLLLTIFCWKNELVTGLAIGLMIQGCMLYLFDHTAATRGKLYVDFLKSL